MKYYPAMLSANPSGVSETECVCPGRQSLRYCGSAQRSQMSSPSRMSVTMQGMFLEMYFWWNQRGLNCISSQVILSISRGIHISEVYCIFYSRRGQGWVLVARSSLMARFLGCGVLSMVKSQSGWEYQRLQSYLEWQWQFMVNNWTVDLIITLVSEQ